MDYMPLSPDAINYALKLIGKTMSVKSIKKWIRQYYKEKKADKVKEQPEFTGNKIIDKITKDRPVKPDQGLYPHEFLFLIAHAENRITKLKEFPSCLKMLRTGKTTKHNLIHSQEENPDI